MRATAGLPFLLEEGDEVAFVPPQTDMPRRAAVVSVRMLDEDSAEVEFDGVGGGEASGLVGCHCLIRRDELDESLFVEEPVFWDGWTVIDEACGELGCVSDIIDNPAQTLLEVARADGEGAVLIPVVEEIVHEVDAEARTIHVAIPDGLLDLNS